MGLLKDIILAHMYESLDSDEFEYEEFEDPYAVYIEYPGNVNDDVIEERKFKKKVIRNGKKLIKWKTDKPGYKIQIVNGRPKEVRIKAAEKIMLKRRAKKTARKNKSHKAMLNRNRAKSMKKRSSMGLK